MNIHIIRSDRKTISIQITRDLQVVVRAPRQLGRGEIERLVEEKRGWIESHMEKVRGELKREEEAAGERLSEDEIRELADRALKVIPERVRHFAKVVGVTYGHITIRNQRTRWGSCSSKGNLNFNCLLMLAPKYVIDYVVVHELCHRKEMNHSKAFWAEVERVLPEYKKSVEWLKIEGPSIMRRMG